MNIPKVKSLWFVAALGLLLVNQTPLISQNADADTAKSGVRRDVVVAIGQDAELKAGDTAPQVVVIGGNAKISGAVDEDVVVIGGDATINGDVDDNVVVVMGTVHLGPKAKIHHDLVVVGGTTDLAEGATVEGRTQEVAVGLPLGPVLRLEWLKTWLANCVMKFRPLSLNVGWIWWFEGAFVLLYLLVAVLFPYPVEYCYKQISERPGTTFAVGILAKVLIPMLLILLAATVIGILVVPFVIVAAMVGAVVGKVALLEYVGARIGAPIGLQGGQRPLAAFAIGTVLVTIVYLVPVLGVFAFLAFGLWGLGVGVTAGWIALRREKRAALPPSAPPLSASPAPGDVVASAPPVTPPPAISFPRAGFWERMGAGFLDMALVSLTTAVVGPFGILVAIAYFSGMWAWKGTTVGGVVLNLQVVREDGHPLNFLASLVRSIAALFSILALFLGFFWIGWDRHKQGWHDKIAGTVVVRLPRAISLVCI